MRENNQAGGFTHIWAYDNAGNILSRAEYDYTTGEPGTPKDTVSYSYGDDDWGDLLTAYDGNTITHDEIGNPLYDGTWTYTWRHGRQLASMSRSTETWNFTYNADGLRTKRTNGSKTYNYVYNGDKLSQMTVGNETLIFAYDASGTPMTVTYDSSADTVDAVTYYYVTNIQGDVIAIVNASGTKIAEYAYDAWGKLLSITGDMAEFLGEVNPLRYRGYVYDQEYGLYYLQSRYYDPEVGRFLNADALVSTGQGVLGNNMFAYCNNNPVKYIDPAGTYMLYEDALRPGCGMSSISAAGNTSAGGGGGSPSGCGIGADITSFFAWLVSLADVTTLAKHDPVVLDEEETRVIADTVTKEPDDTVLFPSNPYDFNPKGLQMHVCVEPGTGTNGGVIKWEIPGTKIAVFEWNEDREKGSHYHTMKIEWNNKHYGPHYPIGFKVPEPWKSTYF